MKSICVFLFKTGALSLISLLLRIWLVVLDLGFLEILTLKDQSCGVFFCFLRHSYFHRLLLASATKWFRAYFWDGENFEGKLLVPRLLWHCISYFLKIFMYFDKLPTSFPLPLVFTVISYKGPKGSYFHGRGWDTVADNVTSSTNKVSFNLNSKANIKKCVWVGWGGKMTVYEDHQEITEAISINPLFSTYPAKLCRPAELTEAIV